MHIINIYNFITLTLISYITGIPSLINYNLDKNSATRPEALQYRPLSQAHAVTQLAIEPEVNPDDGDISMFRFVNPSQLPKGAMLVSEDETEDLNNAFVIGMSPMVMENNPKEENKFLNTKSIGEIPKVQYNSEGQYNGNSKSLFSGNNAIINPASYFLQGGNFEKINKPNCQMVGCDGPYPEDIMNHVREPFTEISEKNVPQTCKQHFVGLNACSNNKGYSIGMICTICCECNEEFIHELKKTIGYKQN
uniref:Col_cuticle_N domain-containing protein n=1 Tax=Strongyloides stercoralis TaxID=6248 RepID=A0A0K0DU63_STRER